MKDLIRRLAESTAGKFRTVDDDRPSFGLGVEVEAVVAHIVRETFAHSEGALEIVEERRRQIIEKGYDAEHDDEHTDGQIAMAAACYAVAGTKAAVTTTTPEADSDGFRWTDDAWPWHPRYDKRRFYDRTLLLKIAGGLIAAEIDREKRAAETAKSPPPVPPDLDRCQCIITPPHNPFGIGHTPPKPERCKSRPEFIATETEPGEDGHRGSMSVCKPCSLKLPDGIATLDPIPPSIEEDTEGGPIGPFRSWGPPVA